MAWKAIGEWVSEVKEYGTNQNDKMNYLLPEMKWPIMCAAGTGGPTVFSYQSERSLVSLCLLDSNPKDGMAYYLSVSKAL